MDSWVIILSIFSMAMVVGNIALLLRLSTTSGNKSDGFKIILAKNSKGKRVKLYKIIIDGKGYLFNFTQLRYAHTKYKKAHVNRD